MMIDIKGGQEASFRRENAYSWGNVYFFKAYVKCPGGPIQEVIEHKTWALVGKSALD